MKIHKTPKQIDFVPPKGKRGPKCKYDYDEIFSRIKKVPNQEFFVRSIKNWSSHPHSTFRRFKSQGFKITCRVDKGNPTILNVYGVYRENI